MSRRNKNIFIRKENEFSISRGSGLPVFANVTGYDEDVGNVVYQVNYPVVVKRSGVTWRYEPDNRFIPDSDEYIPEYIQPAGPTIYVKPLEEFLKLFTTDFEDEFARYRD